MWAPQQKFTPAFVNSLLSHTEGERAAAAWLLLAKIASCSPKLNFSTILDTWEKIIRSENRAEEVEFVVSSNHMVNVQTVIKERGQRVCRFFCE